MSSSYLKGARKRSEEAKMGRKKNTHTQKKTPIGTFVKTKKTMKMTRLK